jgi:hypothetical protein
MLIFEENWNVDRLWFQANGNWLRLSPNNLIAWLNNLTWLAGLVIKPDASELNEFLDSGA